jgi:hypothetical protein
VLRKQEEETTMSASKEHVLVGAREAEAAWMDTIGGLESRYKGLTFRSSLEEPKEW